MISENKKIIDHLQKVETLADMLKKEAAEGRKLLQKKEIIPVYNEGIEARMLKRKLRVLSNLNKKTAATNNG